MISSEEHFLVRGTLRDAMGRGLRDYVVRAFDQDMRNQQELGRSVTNATGEYRIEYDSALTRKAELGGPDLVLVVDSLYGGEPLLVTEIQFNAPSIVNRDITLLDLGGEADFDRIARLVEPLLAGQGVTFETLEEDDETHDLRFAAAETGIGIDALRDFAVAHRLTKSVRIEAEFWFGVLRAGAFPSRSLTPASLASHARQVIQAAARVTRSEIDTALKRAFNESWISKRPAEEVKVWLSEYESLRDEDGESVAGKHGLGDLLKATSLDPTVHDAATKAILAGGSRREILARVADDTKISAEEAQSLDAALALSDLTLGNTHLVRHLGDDVRSGKSVGALAAGRSQQEWRKAIQESGAPIPGVVAGKTNEERISNYAALIARRVAIAHPTAAFAGALERAAKEKAKIALKDPGVVHGFLDKHPEFELATTSVDRFLKLNLRPGTVEPAKRGALAQDLKAVQRVFKLAPNFDATNALLADNRHSAQKIYRMGRDRFVREYEGKPGFTRELAAETFNRAANTHAAAATILGEVRSTQTANDFLSTRNAVRALEDFPNLTNLFGKGDVCLCEECRSIFSPSAYLADTLMFLADRLSRTPGKSVKDVLLSRRADLGYVELSCENSHTRLPMIDLACEVLEDRVAPWKLFNMNVALEPLLVKGAVHANVVAAFATAVPPVTLSASATVSDRDSLRSWVIRDDKATYRILKYGGSLRVSLLRQTRGTEEELSAAPEYVNEPAYAVLGAAKGALSLPFDLAVEELRAYAKTAGTSYGELMRMLRGNAAPNNPQNLDIAAEALNIARSEQDLIFTPDPANQFKYWGAVSNAAAIASMSRVDQFLRRTGLEFADLQRMLDLDFIRKPGNLGIVDEDASCDTDKKSIQPLNADALDRIHRFLRLWRKLGWKMWEVDLAIGHPALGNGALDQNLAIRLGEFVRLQEKLPSLSVDQLAACFGNIETRSSFTEATENRDPSLYERLFLNRRFSNPPDPAFAIGKVAAAGAVEPIRDAVAGIDHTGLILAATRLKPVELDLIMTLEKPGAAWAAAGVPDKYLPDGILKLANLSFIHRHALVSRVLGIKVADWAKLLYVMQSDPFASPLALLDFLELHERIKASGLTVADLSYVLAGDRTAKAAATEKSVDTLLGNLRKALQGVALATDPTALPLTSEALSEAIASWVQALGWSQESAGEVVAALTGTFQIQRPAPGLPVAFKIPLAIRNTMDIAYDSTAGAIRFTGFMTDVELAALQADAVLAAQPAVQKAVTELHEYPRLLVKLFKPLFRAPLDSLPPAIAFPAPLAGRVSYNAERHELTCFQFLTTDERDSLKALAGATPTYTAAVDSLYNQARAGGFDPSELWLATADLTFPLAANVEANLTKAATKLAACVNSTLSRDEVTRQLGAATQLPAAMVERILDEFNPLALAAPHALMDDYLDPAFVRSSSAMRFADYTPKYEAYYWLHRLAHSLRLMKATSSELEWLQGHHAAAALLDPASLPLRYDSTIPAVASLSSFMDLADLLAFHHGRSTPDLSLLEMIDSLISDPAYDAAKFSADLEKACEWPKGDVAFLLGAGGLDIAFPAAYCAQAGWRRLGDAVSQLPRLGSAAKAACALANPTPKIADVTALKQCLRSKYDDSTWLETSKGVQDTLRERKRDALIAYLLTRKMPIDAPTQKWENANDLFAYNLIDVQMCSCQPTSRVVQASAAVQLFVQRCFLGVEPAVRVSVDEDSDWSQWNWARQYRTFEANRRVFAFPESYADPGLRRDKSEIFEAFEKELMQNEVNRDNVETAFLKYLERLDEVAQLEIAGTYYHEEKHTLHVFGRTPGGDPRTYFQRQFVDGRRWTSWKKVDCEIRADYLVPLVANERLHLVWPEIREEPEATGAMAVPDRTATSFTPTKHQKTYNLFLAVTEFRGGKWLPKKISQDKVQLMQGDNTLRADRLVIVPVDLGWLPSRLYPGGTPAPGVLDPGFDLLVEGGMLLLAFAEGDYQSGTLQSSRDWVFELTGCRGYPETAAYRMGLRPILTHFDRDHMWYMKNVEGAVRKAGYDDLTPMPNASIHLKSTILGRTPGKFRITYSKSLSYFDRLFLGGFAQLSMQNTPIGDWLREAGLPMPMGTFHDWFYADKLRTFLVQPELVSRSGQAATLFYADVVALTQKLIDLAAGANTQELQDVIGALAPADYQLSLLFTPFYHPLTCLFTKSLYAKGVEGLFAREVQFADKGLDFNLEYQPTSIVDRDFPREIVDFDPRASMAKYNWELFYFCPLTVALRLCRNQRFEEARRWFHFIFDPTGAKDKDPNGGAAAGTPQKYWITKPFYERQSAQYLEQRLQNLMSLLAETPGNPVPTQLQKELQDQVLDWRRNPFDPHLVAQYRTVAYQKLTVLKYVDCLIQWADQLFRTHTLETVNEATLLYVLAQEILGPRPRRVPPRTKPVPETFMELESRLDDFSNAIVEFENLIPPMPSGDEGTMPVGAIPHPLYFCIPQNEEMMRAWDVVDQRLYNIRHCLDIEGVFNPPGLLAPQIDVNALLGALAGGADLNAAIADIGAPVPHYRFTTMLQKANEFTNDVKALGAALLGALEKKDGEGLATLRQGQEIRTLQAVRAIKEKQLDDAKLNLEGLQKNKAVVTERLSFYSGREFMNTGETVAMGLTTGSLALQAGAMAADILGGILAAIPDFQLGASGVGGSPHVTAKTGGISFSKAVEMSGRGMSQMAGIIDKGASMVSTLAGYQRRMEDWQLQATLARREIEQIDKQIASGGVKVDIAQKELDNHDLQIENAKSIERFMRDKYTNEELYDWTIGQISQTFFQSYQLAFDLAKRAERCFRYELGVASSAYVQFGHWDNLRSGLQAGESLQLDLRRLDSAYLDQNRRELECTKHVSLAMTDPGALLALIDQGSCTFELPEEIFDLDFPGHYFRRIKAVAISIPCIAGPNTTVNATLRLIKSTIRVTSSTAPQYEHNNDDGVLTDDPRFRESHVRVNSIATSTGQNDSGLFELNFRDERYLPFEGAGVISTWRLELTPERELRQFDYMTIPDVVIHVRYTAREDAGAFRTSAVGHLKTVLSPGAPTMTLRRVFDLRHDFATEWHAFMHPAAGAQKRLVIKLLKAHFPELARGADVEIQRLSVIAKTEANEDYIVEFTPTITSVGGTKNFITLGPGVVARGMRSGSSDESLAIALDEAVPWSLKIRRTTGTFATLTETDLDQCFLLVEYTLPPLP